MRILTVEDDPKLSGLLARGLREEGHAVDVAGSIEDGLWLARSARFDVIVLDRRLPDGDGVALCQQLRADGVWTPVLMLTALDTTAARVSGLDGGADDYLTKPFDFDELLARLRALTRRIWPVRPVVLTVGDLKLDPAARRVTRAGIQVALTAKEFALLETFMRNPGRLLSRGELVDQAWDFAYESRSNVVDVHVKSLREKIDRPFDRNTIETLRGEGYRLRDDVG